jgi:hypothetical protein
MSGVHAGFPGLNGTLWYLQATTPNTGGEQGQKNNAAR